MKTQCWNKVWLGMLCPILLLIACGEVREGGVSMPLENEPLQLLPDYFFDQGAWFGMKCLEDQLGLATPVFLDQVDQRSLEDDLISIDIHLDGNSRKLEPQNYYTPGKIGQHASDSVLIADLGCVYESDSIVLVALRLMNQTDQEFVLSTWMDFADNYISRGDRIILYDVGSSLLQFECSVASIVNAGEIHTEAILLPRDTIEIFFALNYSMDSLKRFEKYDFSKLTQSFVDAGNRWSTYLETTDSYEPQEKLLAKKCVQTLVNNWRKSSGQLAFDGLFPSYYPSYFNGVWAWDSWKHAVAVSRFHPELAQDQIKCMFDFQNEHGMVADVFYRDESFDLTNWRNTKPPLAGWAVSEVFRHSNDTLFLQEIFPKLLDYHRWWYIHRDHDQNGLCEYGSTDGTRVAAAWESGMDNAVRFDDAKMVENGSGAWSLDQESVDLNAYLSAEKSYLSELADMLGKKELATSLMEEAVALTKTINDTFYDEIDGYYYDRNITSGELVKVKGPESWIPLWVGIADQSQAEAVVSIITDSKHFNTFCPFPTLDASHPEFNPENGYWRGPVWLDQAYFALSGMRRYGFDQEASQMQRNLMYNGHGILDENAAIMENYHPVSGAGLNAPHFSWSAAHLLLMLEEN